MGGILLLLREKMVFHGVNSLSSPRKDFLELLTMWRRRWRYRKGFPWQGFFREWCDYVAPPVVVRASLAEAFLRIL